MRRFAAQAVALVSAIVGVALFIYLLRQQQVYGPYAFLASATAFFTILAASIAIDPPSPGMPRKITWLGFGAGVLAVLICAAIMSMEARR
jgi:hypothetical protein